MAVSMRSSSGTVDTALIREQWDQLVRRGGLTAQPDGPGPCRLDGASPAVPRPIALPRPSPRLGRAFRSLYLLRYIHEEDLRGRMQLQLNRGEGRHQLARRLFFANQGAFQTGDYEEIMYRGREGLSPSPPSEPCWRFSRTRLSSRWFPHRDWLACT